MPGFLIDLDGTLYRGKEPIPYADSFIQLLQEKQLPFLLVTNNSSKTPEKVAEHLLHFGIEVLHDNIYTSSQAAAQYMADLQKDRSVYMIGEEGLRASLEDIGFTLTDEHPAYVVQGIDRDFTYAKLAKAVGLIHEGATYVLTNPDHLLPSDGGLMPGAGSIAASIIRASSVEPILIGKPSPIIMTSAIDRLGQQYGLPLSAQDVWVIGDNAATDIRGGAVSGCKTALVLTGVTTPENLHQQLAHAGARPDLICASLQELSFQLGIRN